MSIYIALLRGINVGGKNKIKMADLKAALERIGLSRVQTYIQSGNVLFESQEGEDLLRKRMEQEIESVFGITLTVVIRSSEELEKVVGGCPFTDETLAEAAATCEGESLHVALLPEAPSPAGVAKLAALANREEEEYRIAGRDVYLLFRRSIRSSKLAANLHKLGVPATVRNWNTMNKLSELVNEMKNA